MLIPARTDTRYFHDYILYRSEIRFIKGRVKFGEAKFNAPFPSMIVIFRGAKIREEDTNDQIDGQMSIFDFIGGTE
jgi:site-specific DNA-methyltransferase (adenine-specific)